MLAFRFVFSRSISRRLCHRELYLSNNLLTGDVPEALGNNLRISMLDFGANVMVHAGQNARGENLPDWLSFDKCVLVCTAIHCIHTVLHRSHAQPCFFLVTCVSVKDFARPRLPAASHRQPCSRSLRKLMSAPPFQTLDWLQA
jgi:hypothetical protein